ncbi:MAG TPA: hypothetical protein VF407_13695 [Polyangiaceae bacterium]
MWRRAAVIALSIATWSVAQGCGSDVDLGGSSGGGAGTSVGTQNGSLIFDCDPCHDDDDCDDDEVCARLGDDSFCSAKCTDSCADSEVCETVTTSLGATTRACAPPDGGCFRDFTPSPDDPNVCGPFIGPNEDAGCHSCSNGDDDCRANGCRHGYWCDTLDDECEKAPSTCL